MLSLKGLHLALEEHGVKMPYSSLSQFLKNGDITEQLQAGGKGNRREFPTGTVDFLAQLLPRWEDAHLSKEHAAAFVRLQMRQFLESQNLGANSDDLITGEMVPSSEVLSLVEFERVTQSVEREMVRTMQEFIAMVKDVAPVREDRALTTSQAAALLCCAPKSVGRFVPRLRRGVYRRSDVMKYLATGVKPTSSSACL